MRSTLLPLAFVSFIFIASLHKKMLKFLAPSIILILSATKLTRELLLPVGSILSFSENKVGPKVAKLSLIKNVFL